MTKILYLDVETTPTGKPVEIAACLLIGFKGRLRPTTTISFVCNHTDDSNYQIHGVHPSFYNADLNKLNEKLFGQMVLQADGIMAHNCLFDRAVLIHSTYSKLFENKEWICSLNDWSWHLRRGGDKLSLKDLYLDHGGAIRPVHRALTDVMCAVNLLEMYPDGEEQIKLIKKAHSHREDPVYEFISKRDLDKCSYTTQALKDLGYRWLKHKGKWVGMQGSFKEPNKVKVTKRISLETKEGLALYLSDLLGSMQNKWHKNINCL